MKALALVGICAAMAAAQDIAGTIPAPNGTTNAKVVYSKSVGDANGDGTSEVVTIWRIAAGTGRTHRVTVYDPAAKSNVVDFDLGSTLEHTNNDIANMVDSSDMDGDGNKEIIVGNVVFDPSPTTIGKKKL